VPIPVAASPEAIAAPVREPEVPAAFASLPDLEATVAPRPETKSAIPLYRPPTIAPAPAPVVAVPAPVPVPQPIRLVPTPPPVTVVVAPTPVAAAPAPLRIKAEDPAGYTRPRRILTDVVDEPARSRAFGGSGTAGPGVRWKIAAAAGIILAVGAFAGRPYLSGLTDGPAVAEAAPPVTPAPVAASTDVGGLQIDTQPAGAAVLLNGEDVGRTPLKLDNVKPGRHVVTLTTDSASVRRTVRIEAGKVVTLDVAVYSGWVAIYSPVPLHVSEAGRSLGTTDSTRIMLSPGRHELTLTNRELGYSSRQTVEIVPGEERVLNIEPKGTVNVNALPWAEVWVDGTRMGETPIANLEVPLGTREFVFKHPTYGERRLTTTITAKAPPISVDLTKPGTHP
jgi:hypothetical protein